MATSTAALASRLPPVELVFLRCAFGLLVLCAYFALRRRGPNLSNPLGLLLRGVFGTLAVFSYFFAIEQLGAGPATVLNFISPCYAAILAPIFLNERSSRLVLFGLGISTVGACLVAWGGSAHQLPTGHLGLGIVAGLVSGIAGGASTTTNRALRSSDTDASTIFFAFCFVGLLLTAPFVVQHPVMPARSDWPMVLLLVVTSVAGQLLYSHALGSTEVVLAGVINQLVPVFTFALAVLFLHQLPQRITLAGAALCIAGVLVGVWPKDRPAPAETVTPVIPPPT